MITHLLSHFKYDHPLKNVSMTQICRAFIAKKKNAQKASLANG